MDKISTVSSQAVLKISSFSMDTGSMSSSPLVSSLVKNRLFKTAPDIDQPPFQFIHIMDLSVVDTMLHDSPDLVIHRTETWAAWRPRLGRKKFGVSWRSSSTAARARRSVLVHCPADTMRIAGSSMTSLWRREAASKKSVKDITRISYFVTTMKLSHELQIYSTVFAKKCIRLHFYRASAYWRAIWYSNSVRPSVCLSVRYVPVSDENGLTYRHSFFTIR